MVLAGRVGCKLKVAVGSMNVELAEIRAWVDGELDEPRASVVGNACLLYTSPSPRDRQKSRMPSSA